MKVPEEFLPLTVCSDDTKFLCLYTTVQTNPYRVEWSGPGDRFAQSPWALTTETAHSSSHSWTDSPGGNYENDVNVSLWSPPLNFSDLSAVTLAFWHRYDLENNFDFGSVWITTDGGATFTLLTSFTGVKTTWTHATVNLNTFAGEPSVQIVFQLFSDSSITQDGWYIDDVLVTGSNDSTVAITLLNSSSHLNQQERKQIAPLFSAKR